MMTIQTLKAEATRRGHFYDNKEKAMANWSKTWGLGMWWKDLWAYKEYTLGDFCMRVGNVYRRHGSYRHDDYFYKGESVSLYKFKKLLASADEPEITPEEQTYIDEQRKIYLVREREIKARRAALRSRRRIARDCDVDQTLWPSLAFSF